MSEYLQWIGENVGSTRSKRLYKSRKNGRRLRKTHHRTLNQTKFEKSVQDLVEKIPSVLADIRVLRKLQDKAFSLAREIKTLERELRSRASNPSTTTVWWSLPPSIPNRDIFAAYGGNGLEQLKMRHLQLTETNCKIRSLITRLFSQIYEYNPDYDFDRFLEPREL